jgi:hypothetical protein
MRALVVVAAVVACGKPAAPVSGPAPEGTPSPPQTDHAEASLAACEPLEPTAFNQRLGQLPRGPVALAGPGVHGAPINIATLRGKVVLVSFQASWDTLSKDEQPTFEDLARAVGGELAIVRVASEDRIEDARVASTPEKLYMTMFDAMVDCGSDASALGVLTRSWGVQYIPESFLLDRAGNVRFYFVNKRDWSSPEAAACVRALLDDPMPPIVSAQPPQRDPCAPRPAVDPTQKVTGTIHVATRTPGTVFVAVMRADMRGRPVFQPLAFAKLEFRGDDLTFALDGTMTTSPKRQGETLTGGVVVVARFDADGDPGTLGDDDLAGTVRATAPASGLELVLDRAPDPNTGF